MGSCSPLPGCFQAAVWALVGDWRQPLLLLSSGWCHIHHSLPAAHTDPHPPPPYPLLVAVSAHLWWRDSLMHKVFTALLLQCHNEVLHAGFCYCHFTAVLHDVPISKKRLFSGRKWTLTQHNDMLGVTPAHPQFHLWLLLCLLSSRPIIPSLTHLRCTSFHTHCHRHCLRLSWTYSVTIKQMRCILCLHHNHKADR